MKYKSILLLSISLIIVFLLSVLGISLYISDRLLLSIRMEEKSHRIQISRLAKEIEEKSAPSNNLSYNKKFSLSQCSAISDFPAVDLNSEILEDYLAYQWPENYVKNFKQKFNPKTFMLNALAYKCYAETKTKRWRKRFLKLFISRLKEYTVEDKGASFVVYKFPFKPLDYDMPVPWRSAYGQGQILTGLTFLDFKKDNAEINQLAHKFFKSYIASERDYEISFRDLSNNYWLDEYPLPGRKPTSYVLNGHIWSSLGLYFYWVHTNNETALNLFSSSVKTMRDVALLYRYEGRVNCYDLRTCELDYDYERAFRQYEWYYQITNDYFFKVAHEVFKRDFEVMKKYKNKYKECRKNVLYKIKCLLFPENILVLH